MNKLVDPLKKTSKYVIAEEKKEIFKQREKRGTNQNNRWIGLALSGGGIRSASFGLGVLQALALKRLGEKLRKVDYLSTVSGGGYIGSALSWSNFLNPITVKAKEKQSWKFLFGFPGVGARKKEEDENDVLDYIRQHGDYLSPANSLNMMSLLATVLRVILYTSTVYFLLLLALLAVGINLGFVGKTFDASWNYAITWKQATSLSLYLTIFLVFIFVATTVAYASVSTFARIGDWGDYRIRIYYQKFLGWLITFIIALLLLASLHIIYSYLSILDGNVGIILGTGSTATGIAGAAYEFLKVRSNKKKVPITSLRVSILAFLLIYGLLLLAYGLLILLPDDSLMIMALVFAGLGISLGYVVNINYFGIGYMYRDRLMETFLPDTQAVWSGKWKLAKHANKVKLGDLYDEKQSFGPYHLINSNAVLVDSDNTKYRGRGGDSFLLSPLFCGCDATGWYSTKHFMENSMTLATAMAISGAATNPNTGVAGQGVTRNRLVSFLMAFLGIRLGYWIRNPAAKGYRRYLAKFFFQPCLLYPGLFQGLLGQKLNEDAGFMELTDGGHFENLGFYELARRQLDVIIISDAGADPEFSMSDLGVAIERLRVDYGYYVEFDKFENKTKNKYKLMYTMPGSSDNDTFFDKKYKLAKHGFAVGKISYGANKSGTIIYIKSTLVDGLPEDLYAYKTANSDFPHQSTMDQIFDEEQFEAYRELGYQLCKQMLQVNDQRIDKWIP